MRQIKCDHSRAQVLSLFLLFSVFWGLFQLSIHELRAAAYTTCSPTLCALFGQELFWLPYDSQPCCATSLCHTCPAPTPTALTEILRSACIYFVSFITKKRGWKPQLWKASVVSSDKVFLAFLFSFPPCVFTHRAQPRPSSPSRDPITLYPCAVPHLPQLLTQIWLLIQASCRFGTFL